MNSTNLPQESESQEIGQLAVLGFERWHPLNWRKTATDGDNDAGLDFQIQVIDQIQDQNNQKRKVYSNLFHAQIKGAKLNKLNSTKEYYSISIEIKTLNYYARIESPVMLIFVDLTKNDDPRSCPAFYLWIDDVLTDLLDGNSDLSHLNKDSHTFNIPTDNVLEPDVNVIPYLSNRIANKHAFSCIINKLGHNYQDSTNKLSQITNTFLTKNIAFETILNETDTPWLDAPQNSIAFKLKESNSSLNSNNSKLSEKRLCDISKLLSNANDHEHAEYAYQNARLLELKGNHLESLEFLKNAHELLPKNERYHVAYLHAKINSNPSNTQLLQSVFNDIESLQDPSFIKIKSKILALQKQDKEALSILNKINDDEASVLKALIYYLSESYFNCIDHIENIQDKPSLNDNQIFSIKAIKSRCYFTLAFNIKLVPGNFIPFCGINSIDQEYFKKAWDEIASAWEFAKTIGFPHSIDITLDVFLITGMYFSETDFVKYYLIQLAEIRPENRYIQESLLHLALYLDDRPLAKKQLLKVPKNIPNTINEIFLESRANNKSQVINLTNQIFDDLINEKPQQYEIVLAVAAHCANELLQYDNRNKFLEALKQHPESKVIYAIYDFIQQKIQNSLKSQDKLQTLYDLFIDGHRNDQLIGQLLSNLDPTKKESAEKLIHIYSHLNERDLYETEYLSLCQALATVFNWDELQRISSKAGVRFSNNPIFKTFEALAFDEIGKTGNAIKILEELLNYETFSINAFELYINISARCGNLHKAKALSYKLLEKTNSNPNKLNLLSLIFNIEFNIDCNNPVLLDICIQFGQINNQNDEREEGQYINQFLTATLNSNCHVKDEYCSEFKKRSNTYFEKFPNSKYIRSISLNPNESAEGLLNQLSKLTGFDDEKKEWYRKNEIVLKSNEHPIPYIMRAYLLLNISNFIHLWETSKIFGREFSQYHLTINSGQYEIHKDKIFTTRKILIDEISILVLFDLGLLDHLLSALTKRIAISKYTILSFTQISQNNLYSLYAQKASDILDILHKHIDDFTQPSSNKLPISNYKQHDVLKIIKDIFDPSKYVYYSDDYFSRLYICGLESYKQEAISTIDIIEIFKSYNTITQHEAAIAYAQLCKFNVIGVPVNFRDILITLQPSLPDNLPVAKYIELINQNDNFNAFIEAIWWIKTAYTKALSDISSFLSFMICETDNIKVERNIISAIWYIWYSKIQFFSKSEENKINFFARSFLYTAYQLYNDYLKNKIKNRIVLLWSIYNDVISTAYDNQMDKNIEDNSKRALVKMILEAEKNHKPIFEYILSGLTSGTNESDLFNNYYIEDYIKLET